MRGLTTSGEYGALDLPTPSSPVDRIMSAPAITIDATATIRQAAEGLAEAQVSALVVVEHGFPVGVITERDIVRLLAHNVDPDNSRVVHAVDPHVVWAHPWDSITHVAGLMRRSNIRHVPVRNEFGLLGIVSISDVLDAILPSAKAAC